MCMLSFDLKIMRSRQGDEPGYRKSNWDCTQES